MKVFVILTTFLVLVSLCSAVPADQKRQLPTRKTGQMPTSLIQRKKAFAIGEKIHNLAGPHDLAATKRSPRRHPKLHQIRRSRNQRSIDELAKKTRYHVTSEGDLSKTI